MQKFPLKVIFVIQAKSNASTEDSTCCLTDILNILSELLSEAV